MNDQNIYKIARERAGMTLMRAAELLRISCRALSKYESGEVIPSFSRVMDMCCVYISERLLYEHFRTFDDDGIVVPIINATDLPRAALAVLTEHEDISLLRSDIARISADGKITPDEFAIWERIYREINELQSALCALKFLGEEQRENSEREERRGYRP